MKGKGLTAYITVHEATGMYREALDGWGSDHNTLNEALDGACRRILNKSKKPSKDTLLKGLQDFYKTLKCMSSAQMGQNGPLSRRHLGPLLVWLD